MEIEPSQLIENAGFTETVYQENGTRKQNAASWDLKYDGNKAHIDLGLNNNGKKENVHMNLTNDDIMKLLEINSIPIPLEKRLTNDFLQNDYLQEEPVPLFMTNQPDIRVRIPKPFNNESNIAFSPEKAKRCKKRTQKKRRKPKKKTKYTTSLRRFLRKLI
jgi:hypothetical protein